MIENCLLADLFLINELIGTAWPLPCGGVEGGWVEMHLSLFKQNNGSQIFRGRLMLVLGECVSQQQGATPAGAYWLTSR